MRRLADYSLETLSQDGDLRLSRAVPAGAGPASLLFLAPTGPGPSPLSLARLQHTFGLRDQLDGAWA